MSSAELRELREAIRLLNLRVDRLQDSVDLLLSRGPGRGISESSGENPPESSAGTFSVVGSEPAAAAATSVPSWEFREEVAREIGSFFVRALGGGNRGSSGRQRLPQLKSRVYIIAKDWEGREYRRPVKVTAKFTEVKSLCSRSGDFADSVFCGVPSIREAKVVVQSAGLEWPADFSI